MNKRAPDAKHKENIAKMAALENNKEIIKKMCKSYHTH